MDSPLPASEETPMPTIIEVAHLAGVSTATVSRVLSNPDRVTEKTRAKVMEVVNRLNYKPNSAARSLRTTRSGRILVTVPDISNPFFANIIRGATEAAREADFSLVLGDTRHNPALENQYAGMLDRTQVDGLIFLGHRMPATLRAATSDKGRPLPVVNGCEYSPDLTVPSVHIDNSRAGADATEYLMGLGHRDFGVITGPLVSPINRDRLDGVMGALHGKGLVDRLRVAEGDYSVESGAQQAADLLQSRISVIFCFSDEMAIGALHAVRAAGLSCPRDISIMGFDDIRIASYLNPGLTTIAQPTFEIGRQAVIMLLQILEGKGAVPPSVTLPHRLIERESTGPVEPR